MNSKSTYIDKGKNKYINRYPVTTVIHLHVQVEVTELLQDLNKFRCAWLGTFHIGILGGMVYSIDGVS